MQILNFEIFSLLLLITLLINYLILSNINYISKITGLVDKPDFIRKLHKTETPLSASFSLVIMFFILLVTNFYANIFDPNINIILIISLFFFIIGVIDDKINLNPYKKIILIGLVFFIFVPQNSQLVITKIFFYDQTSFFFLNKYSLFFTFFCVFCLTNSINLLDGINGLAAGKVFFSILYILLLFNNEFNFFLVIILINILIIFFFIYRGIYFLGNSGSLFLSSFLSMLIIYYINSYWTYNYDNNSWAKDIKIGAEHIFIILMVSGFDMFRLFIERVLKKKDPFEADNEHLHHYLLKLYGLNKALIFYFIFMNIPIILSIFTNLTKHIIIIIFIFVYLFIYLFLKKNCIN